MLEYFGYLLFILTVALAAGGIILSSRLRKKHHNEIFSAMLYFQVFIYTFGFYGIWGQEVVNVLLSTYISQDLLHRFIDIAKLLGLPFLIFAWLMLVQFSILISGRKYNNWFVLWFLLINFSVIVFLGYLVAKGNMFKPAILIKDYFISMHCLYGLISFFIILFPGKGKSFIHDFDKRRIGSGLLLSVLLQSIPLFFYDSQPLLALIFTLTFFAGNVFLPVYFTYGTIISFTGDSEKDLSFEEFCKKFDVSPRETDIVREICNGLSNKEISDKLFISLQTVKDHTHRIYQKTNVKSRGQLIFLVKELKIKQTELRNA